MEELKKRLEAVDDSYFDFILGVITYCKRKESRLIAVMKFMDDNPDALSSDIIEFISDQPDFYEDSVYVEVS